MADQQSVEDGLVLFYVKDGTLYPVALTGEQKETFGFLMKVMPQPIKIISDMPIGKVQNLAQHLENR